MRLSEKSLTIFFVTFFIAMAVWSIALYMTGQTTTQWNYLFNVGTAFLFLSGGLFAFQQVKKSPIKSSVDSELIAIGIGVTLFGIGLLIWSYYNLVLNVESPFPSLSDVVYVFYAPILGYGLVNLLRVYGVKMTKSIYLQFFAVFVITAILILNFIIRPDISSEASLLTKMLLFYYPLADALLVTLGIMIFRLTRGKLHNSFNYFLIALFSMAFADFLFSYRTAVETYYNGDFSDVLYALTGLLFTLGIIRIVATQAILQKYFPENDTRDKLS
jgi:hypothetical protein